MATALPDALFALAQANFAAGAEFGPIVRENVSTARMKVHCDQDNIAGVRLPTFAPRVGTSDGAPLLPLD
jgi:vacuolar-type H+-ATPase subunit D/Vma8